MKADEKPEIERTGELNEFLVRFWNGARELSDAQSIAKLACRLLLEKLAVERAYWAELDWATRDYVIGASFHVPEVSVIDGRFPLDAWEPFTSFHLAGTPVVVNDAQTDSRIPTDVRDGYARIGVGADLATPVISGGQLRCTLAVNQRSTREWTAQEVALVQGIARWCWAEVERARAETALRESEQNLQGVANISPDLLWYSAPDGLSLWYNDRWLEYTGQTLEQATGWGWLEAIHPDDRETSARRYREAVEQCKPLQQEHRIRRHTGEYRWFLVRAEPVLDEHGRVTRMYGAATDIQFQREAMEALRESEEQQRSTQERQAFFLKLSDGLRTEPDADAVALRALRALCDQMGVDRCYIARMRVDENWAEYTHQVGNDRVPPMPAGVRLSDFPKGMDVAFDRTLVIDDLASGKDLSEADRQSLHTFGHRSLIAAFLRKGEREAPVWVLTAVSADPHQWKPGDVALVEETAERTWAAMERARAERALRESQERFQQFADASAAGLWVRDADTLEMEFVSPAVASIYGTEEQALLGAVERWAALIVPDDRGSALRHLAEAREGRTVAHEFRVRRPSDGALRWIKNTDFPLRDHGHIPRIGGIAEDVTEAKLAIEHQAVLLAELQHRVRNIMAMTRSVTQRTARNAQDVPDYAALLSGRLMSLARTQALLTRAANVSVDLASLLHTELSAQANDENQYSLSGPQVELSPKAAEVLSLSIHELATNALKYGAFSVPEGRIHVSWTVSTEQETPLLRLLWTERRPAVPNWTPPTRRGFGSELVERRVPYELDGEGKVVLTPEGASVSIAFPLQPGASILETSAPIPRSVFGGSVDMSGEQVLAGLRILVVEDDYLLAWDTQHALEGAGASVVGPFRKEEEAIAAIQNSDLSVALTDINLGKGPSFEIATALKHAHVPFAFLTGYDQSVIPEEFAQVPRFVKPIDTRRLVRELSRFLQATTTEAQTR